MKITRYFKAHCRKAGSHELTLCGLDAYITPSCFGAKAFYSIVEREEPNICPLCRKGFPLALLGGLP